MTLLSQGVPASDGAAHRWRWVGSGRWHFCHLRTRLTGHSSAEPVSQLPESAARLDPSGAAAHKLPLRVRSCHGNSTNKIGA